MPDYNLGYQNADAHGRGRFEVLDSYLQSVLLAGSEPELTPGHSFLLDSNRTLAQFSVVGLNAAGALELHVRRPSIAATNTLTLSGNAVANETVTIGARVYTWVSSLTAANQVLVGADATASATNLVAAIMGTGGAGYHAATVPNLEVSASNAAGVVTLTSRVLGADGNDLVATETMTNAAFAASRFSGGRQGTRPIGVLAHAAASGANNTTVRGIVWLTGCFNVDGPFVWDASYSTEAMRIDAFQGASAPTNIIFRKRTQF